MYSQDEIDALILEVGYALSDSQAILLLDQIGVERDKFFQDRSRELADRGTSFVGQIIEE